MSEDRAIELPPALQAYFDAWNRHDGPGIVATFVPGGTYADPLTAGPLSGDAIARYAEGLWGSFPDLRFDLNGTVMGDGKTVYLPWKMQGTNTGPFNELPPTGKAVALPGVDIVRLASDGVQSVTGYFDSREVPTQLGLQVLVLPHAIGPFTFGTSTRVTSGRTGTPAGFAWTSLEPRTPAEAEEIKRLGRETLKDMLAMDGFIAATTVTCGKRQMTFSSWEKQEDIARLRNSKAHNEAMRRFYGQDLAQGGLIGKLQLEHMMTMQRCPQCDRMVNIERSQGLCSCGQRVEAASYW